MRAWSRRLAELGPERVIDNDRPAIGERFDGMAGVGRHDGYFAGSRNFGHAVNGHFQVVEFELALNVSGSVQYQISWDLALLLHNKRIDGIGYHPWFNDVDGADQEGWHRHVWDEQKQHAKNKRSVQGFDGDLSFEEFLIRAFKELRVSYNKVDGDTGLL